MELRHDEFERALKLLTRAVAVSDRVLRMKAQDVTGLPPQQRVWKNTKVGAGLCWVQLATLFRKSSDKIISSYFFATSMSV
jgi:hypothetical protein